MATSNFLSPSSSVPDDAIPDPRHHRNILSPRRPTGIAPPFRSEEQTSELQSLMRISYAVFCLKKKKQQHTKYTSDDFNILLHQLQNTNDSKIYRHIIKILS